MAYLVENEKKFKVIKMDHSEILNTFQGSLCICDYCNKAATTKKGMGGYYIAVLNRIYCEDCFNKWLERAVNHPEDRQTELRNFTFVYKKNNVIQVPFFWGDEFISDIDDEFIERICDLYALKNPHELHEDFKMQFTGAEQQAIFVLSEDHIIDGIDDDRLPEDPDNVFSDIKKILSENIDFGKINALIPTLYYEQPTQKFYLTKKDLINDFS